MVNKHQDLILYYGLFIILKGDINRIGKFYLVKLIAVLIKLCKLKILENPLIIILNMNKKVKYNKLYI